MKTPHIIALVSSALLLATPAGAITMQEMFDQVNAYSNTTKPGAYQAQAMNLYTGGSMFMRTPQRSFQLASATPPSWGAGCGGIDLFAGGFSFINKDQFVAMLRNIGSNSMGYAFKLALSSISPEINQVLTDLQALANNVNNLNINSCEAAQGIFSASPSKTVNKTQDTLSKTWGAANNVFGDFTDGWDKLKDKAARSQVKKQVKADPANEDVIANGNITWQALKRIPSMDDDTRFLFMSLVGAYIIDDSGVDRGEEIKIIIQPPTGITLVDLIGRPSSDNTQVDILTCLDGDACMSIGIRSYSKKALITMVRERMQKIADSLKAGVRNDADTTANIAFINGTTIPVYKMLAVGSQAPNSAVSDIMIARYQELIAAEYAASYISLALKAINAALAKDKTTSADKAIAVKELTETTAELRKEVTQEMIKVYNGAVTANNVAMEIMQMEKALYTALPASLQQSLAWQKGI